MATNAAEPDWFRRARLTGEVVVSDPPKFDLESYLANYKGKTRIFRLLHIGKTSSYLSSEAFRLAATEARQGKDVELYENIMNTFHEIAPEDPTSAADAAWVNHTRRNTVAESQRLENELKGYKNNLIKESIRMAYDDIGRHYQSIGAISDAIKNFNKEREYCQLPSHISIMVNRLINAHLESQNWMSVEANVQKLRALQGGSSDREKLLASAKLNAAQGLAELSTGQYSRAAKSFLNCSSVLATSQTENPASEDTYSEVMTANDIATYASLCALASMDRAELQERVLKDSNFRHYFEFEPHLRRAVSSFVAGKYSQCLDILSAYRTDYILDVHLFAHYDKLFTRIRDKAIVQYFIPFSRVSFDALATAFKTSEEDIIESLTELIKTDVLLARLDLENGLLIANQSESRAEMFKAAMDASQDYERVLHSRLLRFAITNAGLDVMTPKQLGTGNTDVLVGHNSKGKGKGKAAQGGKGRFMK